MSCDNEMSDAAKRVIWTWRKRGNGSTESIEALRILENILYPEPPENTNRKDLIRACRSCAEGLENDAKLFPDDSRRRATRLYNRAQTLRNAIEATNVL